MTSFKHLFLSILYLFVLVATGLIGFPLIEGWNLGDSLYMTIITLSSVGYGEVHTLSSAGRIFTVILILFALAFMAYFTGSVAKILPEGEILKILGKRKLESRLKKLQDHYIICGYGRIGKLICSELAEAGKEFVIIESNPDEVDKHLRDSKYPYIQDNATSDEALLQAGIKKAIGIVTAVRSDAENVFITLSARELNPKIYILARASDESAEKKLKIAGASKVVSPYTLGGRRMVSALLRPYVTDFLEVTTSFSKDTLQIEELTVESHTPFLGQTLREANLRNTFGVIIVAVRLPNGEMLFNPGPDQLL